MKRDPFEIDMSAERREDGYSILDSVEIDDQGRSSYRGNDNGNGNGNSNPDDGIPHEIMNDDTTRNVLPPPPRKMKRIIGIGGLLGLLYLGGAVNAHKAIGSGCSYAWQGTKSMVVEPFRTTPDELPGLVEKALQRYKKEINSGEYAQAITQLNLALEQQNPPEIKLEKLQRQFAGKSLDTTLKRLAEGNKGNQRKIDYLVGDLVDTLQAYRSSAQRKKYAQQELANFASGLSAEEQKRVLEALRESSPDGLYKTALQVITQINKPYAAAQELAKLLTPPQRQSLASLAAVPTAGGTVSTPYTVAPGKPAGTAKPAAPAVKPAVTVKPALPVPRPAAAAPQLPIKADTSFEKATQRARQLQQLKPEG